MAIKNSRASTSERDTDGQAALTEQTRNQLAEAAEATSLAYRAAESLQQIHQQLTQRAALRHQQMAERLRDANTPGELMAIQSTLVTSGIQETVQYWQDLTAAGLKLQSEMLERISSQRPSNSVAFSGMPVLQAWQNAFTSSVSGSESPVTHH